MTPAESEPEPEPPPEPTPTCDEAPPESVEDVWVFEGSAGPTVAVLDTAYRGCRRLTTIELATGERLHRTIIEPTIDQGMLRLFSVFEHEGKTYAWLHRGDSTRFHLLGLDPPRRVISTSPEALALAVPKVAGVHGARVDGRTIEVVTDQGHKWSVDAFDRSVTALPPAAKVRTEINPDRPWEERQRHACAAGTFEFGFERIYGNRGVELTECPRCRIRWKGGDGPASADVFLEPQVGRLRTTPDRGLRRREARRTDIVPCVGNGWAGSSPRLVLHRESLRDTAANMLSRVRPDGTLHWQHTIGGEDVDAVRVSADRVLLTRGRLRSWDRFRRLDVHDLETGARVWAYPDGR